MTQKNEGPAQAHTELLERIRAIDPAAAEYIEGLQIPSYIPPALDCYFLWSQSPQGHDYWWKIAADLGLGNYAELWAAYKKGGADEVNEAEDVSSD